MSYAQQVTEQDDSGRVEVSWRLFLLYLLIILLCMAGALLCTILVHLLKRYDVFHVNFRTIMWNLVVCLLLNNCLLVLRPMKLLVQYMFGGGGSERVIFFLK